MRPPKRRFLGGSPVITPLGEQAARRAEQGPPRRLPSLRVPVLTFIQYVYYYRELETSRVRPMGVGVRCAGREHRIDLGTEASS
jgi:hypothetical protein